MSDRDTSVIYVDSKHLGLIIGKGGATIKEISQETGCRINISKEEAINNEVPISLEGGPRCIEAARTRINDIVSRQNNRRQFDGGDNRYGSSRNGNSYNGGGGARDYERNDNNYGGRDNSRNDNSYGGRDKSRNDNSYGARDNSRNDNSYGGRDNERNDSRDFGRNESTYNGHQSRDFSHSNGHSVSQNGYNGSSDINSNSYSQPRRTMVDDDNWGGWGKLVEEDTVDSLVFKGGDDDIKTNTKYLSESADNYVPTEDWGIPSHIEDDAPVRKRPANALQKMRSSKDKAFYKVYRNFYVEHPSVAAMSVSEKNKFLMEKNNIMVKEISTEAEKKCNFGRELEDDPEDSIELIPVPKVVPNPVRSFEEAFSRYPDILREIKKQEFDTPSPIQCIGWPVLMSGRDLIGIAQTGTGKTLAFLLPAFIHIEGQPKPREHRQGPTVLILSPTRELAIQIQKEVQKYTYHDIDSVVCYGGADKREQINQLRENPEIVVGTPGRILDLKDSGILCLKDVSYLVLDEADRMLDMGFEIQVVNIIYSVRRQRQTVMTSATWPFSVQRIALTHMQDPVQVNVGTLDLNACHSVTQRVEHVENEAKTARLAELLSEVGPDDKVIVFVARKAQCSDLAYDLFARREAGNLGPKGAVRACEIHGDLDQSERELALRMMRSGARNVMIATDVASRGLDIPDLTMVVNYDFPKNIEEYVHRVGRTGRAGRTGVSITFMNRRDWSGAAELIKIMEDADQVVPDFVPRLMRQYQEYRVNGGSRGARFGGGGGGPRREGGGGGDRGPPRSSGGDRLERIERGGRGADRDSMFGRMTDVSDVRSDSSWDDEDGGDGAWRSRWAAEVAGRVSYVRDGSEDSEEDQGQWGQISPVRKPETVLRKAPSSPATVREPHMVTQGPVRHAATPYMVRDKDHNMYPVVRDFYEESASVAAMTEGEAAALLQQLSQISAQEVRTYPAETAGGQDDDDLDDEASVPLLPARRGIPRAVRSLEEALGRWPSLLAALAHLGIRGPTPIQAIGWPVLLGGRDLIGVAQTGTGKTLAFLLPALVHIQGQTKSRKHRRGPTALILSPTRELAMQIEAEVLKVPFEGIRSVCCYGGADKGPQVSGLRLSPEIVVGTPGRLLDLMEAGHLCLKDVSYLVLDEADRMLDMGFEQQVVRLIGATRRQRQSVMTSATWPEAVRMIALLHMRDPVQVNVGSLDLQACKDVNQELRQIDNARKTEALCDILVGLLSSDKVIVFVTRKKQCRSLTNTLDRMIRSEELGPHISVCEIHGDMDQESREQSLSWFREGRCNVLVATNVASRGLDINDVTYVVNYDFPKDIEEYVHRVGRTGRAGRSGRAITFMNDMDHKHAGELRRILEQSGQEVPPWLMRLRAVRPSPLASHNDNHDNRGRQRQAPIDPDRVRARFSFLDLYDDGDDYDYEDEGDFFDNFQRRVDPSFQVQIVHEEALPLPGVPVVVAVRPTIEDQEYDEENDDEGAWW